MESDIRILPGVGRLAQVRFKVPLESQIVVSGLLDSNNCHSLCIVRKQMLESDH